MYLNNISKDIKNVITLLSMIVNYSVFLKMIDGIKITNYLYISHNYTLNKVIENYIVFGLGSIFFLFFFFVGMVLITTENNINKNKK